MPRAAQICTMPRCTRPTVGRGRCTDHQAPAWVRTSARNTNRPGNLGSLRRQALRRDRWVCQLCGGPGATEVDHITPVSRGGSHDLDNLQAVHSACHAEKTVRDRA